jgi:hypothetical protein
MPSKSVGVQNAERGHPYSRKSTHTTPISREATRLMEGNHDKNNSSSTKLSLCEVCTPTTPERSLYSNPSKEIPE